MLHLHSSRAEITVNSVRIDLLLSVDIEINNFNRLFDERYKLGNL